MGIFGRIIGAGVSAIGASAEAIGNKIENVFLKRKRENLEYIKNYPYTHKFIVREIKEIQDDMIYAEDFGLKKNFFVVYSSSNQPIYLAYSEEKFRKCQYSFVDMAANEIAILVSKKNSCSIVYKNNKYELKSSELFEKRKFTLSYSDCKVDCNNTGSEIKIYKKT